jgi:hypothetical protein
MGGARSSARYTCNVLHHEGGRDSISEKKLRKGDATWKPNEILLGFGASGLSGMDITVSLPLDKKDMYANRIIAALAQPRNLITMGQFKKIHGQLQHAAITMPCMKGFMTPLNRVLASATTTVGLKLNDRPSHISENVSQSLPYYYGYVDAAAVGAGGAKLPCTRWIIPLV